MTTLSDLRKLAEAATPGPWRVEPQHGYTEDYIVTNHPSWQGPGLLRYVGECGLAHGQEKRPQKFQDDAAYIAALSPERVLALLDVIEAAKAMFEAGGVSDEDCAFEAALAAFEKEHGR